MIPLNSFLSIGSTESGTVAQLLRTGGSIWSGLAAPPHRNIHLMGISISTGSACDSNNTDISHVLKAIRLDTEFALGTVRISLGKYNTHEEVERIANALIKVVKNAN